MQRSQFLRGRGLNPLSPAKLPLMGSSSVIERAASNEDEASENVSGPLGNMTLLKCHPDIGGGVGNAPPPPLLLKFTRA